MAILSLAQLSPSLFPNIFRIEGQNHNLSYNYNLFKFDRLSLATGRDTFCCSFCSWWWPGRKNTTTTTPVLLNLSDVLNQRSAAVIIIIPPLINRIYYASSNYHCTTKQKHTHTHTHTRKRTHTHKHTHIYRQTNKTNKHTHTVPILIRNGHICASLTIKSVLPILVDKSDLIGRTATLFPAMLPGQPGHSQI